VPADPRDDFGVFESLEHMFFGLVDPYGAIRREIEDQLRAQVPETVVERIVAHDEPRWRTIARRSPDGARRRDDDPNRMIVTYWGVCFRARIAVSMGYTREDLAATVTFLFGRWDTTEQRVRTFFDLHGDAETGYDDAVFERRFLAFRADDP
jgi:hypothetical protein